MRHTILGVFTAVALGLAGCAGAPPPSAASTGALSCATPHGFTMVGDGNAPLAADADVAEVRTVRDPERPQRALSIRLNDDARGRVERYTTAHVGEHVAITIGDRVVARLKVRDPIAGAVLVTGASEADIADIEARLCAR